MVPTTCKHLTLGMILLWRLITTSRAVGLCFSRTVVRRLVDPLLQHRQILGYINLRKLDEKL